MPKSILSKNLSKPKVLSNCRQTSNQSDRGSIFIAARSMASSDGIREFRASSIHAGMRSLLSLSVLWQEKSRTSTSSDQLSDLSLSQFVIGIRCIKGAKEDYENQDDFGIYLSAQGSLICVLDGHGPTGDRISSFVQSRLMDETVSRLKTGSFRDVEKFFIDKFPEVDRDCIKRDHKIANKEEFDAYNSGTTATIIFLEETKLTVASVGDSRCILGVERSRSSGVYKCFELTKDHSCERVDERKRIKAAGGVVKRLEGDVPYRVFLPGKAYPGLAMTRAIGDASSEQAGIISTPETSTFKISQDGKRRFLVVASDGVWAFLTSQEVIKIVSRYPPENVQGAVDAVVHEALEKWKKISPFAIDDITCIVARIT